MVRDGPSALLTMRAGLVLTTILNKDYTPNYILDTTDPKG